MESEIFGIVAAVVVGALMSLVLKKNHPEQAFLLSLAISIAVFAVCVPALSGVVATLNSVSNAAGLKNTEYLLKSLGICLVTQIGTRVCVDYGNSAAAASLETAGKIAVVALSLPIINELLGYVTELMGI